MHLTFRGLPYAFLFLIALVPCEPLLAQNLKVLPPATGAYHGAYTDFGATETEVSTTKVESFVAMAGKKIAWAYFSNHWLDGVIRFPKESVEACRAAGVVPYIRLQPWSRMEQSKADPVFSMQKFIDGKFDEPLRQWAREARDVGIPLMLEFGPEVNGDWFPWSAKWNGGSQKTRYGSPNIPDGPERFRDAYRHIIDLFRSEGASQVTWVLHVDAQWSPEASWNKAKYYDPGDGYIDWIGVSVFGAQLPSHDWIHFPATLKRFWPQLEETSKTRPILVSEYGVIEDRSSPTRKSKWIQEALQFVSSGAFPRIKGMTYWNSPGWLPNGSASFLIDSSPLALEAYRAEISKPFWLDQIAY